jgi:hypothetical protein
MPNLLDWIRMKLVEIPTGRRFTHAERWEEHGFPSVAVGNGRGIETPSGRYQTAPAGDRLLLSVPSNWRRITASNTAIFAPDRAFANSQDGMAVTHGLQVGVARSVTGVLKGDAQALLGHVAQGNPGLRWTPAFQRTTLGDLRGVTTTASTVSSVTGQFENITVSVAYLPDGTLLYTLAFAPDAEASAYGNVFDTIRQSIEVLK